MNACSSLETLTKIKSLQPILEQVLQICIPTMESNREKLGILRHKTVFIEVICNDNQIPALKKVQDSLLTLG